MTTQQTIITDTITRVYKNGSGTAIAIQKVGVEETRDGTSRTADIKWETTKINEGSSQSRVIATIQQIGNYNTFVEAGGNYTQVTYVDPKGVLANLVVDLSSLNIVSGTI